jgi:hypothetical protein
VVYVVYVVSVFVFSLLFFIFFPFAVHLSFLFPFHLFLSIRAWIWDGHGLGFGVLDSISLGWVGNFSNGRLSVKVSGWDRALQGYQRYPFHRCISIIPHHFNET